MLVRNEGRFQMLPIRTWPKADQGKCAIAPRGPGAA